MAHAARINDLSSKLVASVIGWDPDAPSTKQVINEASKTLRGSGHARTNQFDIRSKLDGLVEKFAVLNREDLAEELQSRLDELPTQSKWLPEVLSLLLSLSDRPLEKTKLEDLQDLSGSSENEQALTWKEIFAADDSADEAGLWDDIERGYHSSGDESGDGEGDATTTTNATSVEEEDLVALARLHIVQPDESLLQPIKEFKYLSESKAIDDLAISELTFIKQWLLLLQGVPATMLTFDPRTGVVTFKHEFTVPTLSKSIQRGALQHLSRIHSSLSYLRCWLGEHTQLLYLQSCKAAVQSILSNFQSQVAAIDAKYASPREDLVVSIIDVESEMETLAEPALHISELIRRSKEHSSASTFAFLDLLYDGICIAQSSEDLHIAKSLTAVFIAGLKTYVRPISTWVRSGKLEDVNNSFFIAEAEADCDLASMWHNRFALRESVNGHTCVPSFVQQFRDRIFALGKSRAFLTALNGSNGLEETTQNISPLAVRSLVVEVGSSSLIPFAQIVDDMLDSWLDAIGQDCTPTLCRAMLYEHGLLTTLNGLATVFCSENNRLFQTFADTLFWRMDARKRWKDSFLLSELAQSTLGSADSVSAETLSVLVKDNEKDLPSSFVAQLGAIRLEMLFTWPIQNIARSRSPTSYSDTFTLLLQIYRIKYLIRRQFDTLRGLGKRKERIPQTTAKALRLRQVCAVLVDILYNHVTTAASILSVAVRRHIERADGIDAMAGIWSEHEKQLRIALLLTPNLKPLHDAVVDILQGCERFCETWQGLLDSITITGESKGYDASEADLKHEGTGSDFSSAPRTLATLHADLEKSIGFLLAGARATSRASGSATLEALSDRLERCLLYRL